MADRSGQQLGNYRLLNLLGQGGFAEVYLGEHVYLRTKAAIKILQMRLAVNDQEGLEGFLTEARTIANLVHPNIVRVLEFGLDGETPFLVMDYAPNGTLRQKYPKSRRLTLQEIAGSVKQVAAALQYAHNERLIHRDVKPENMLVGRHDEILLSDFGIALVAQSSRYQGTSDVVGTVAYMSPEQIQGKPRPASDQYSLGIVVYEWLTGERPFRGSFTELCTQHMFATPDPIRGKVPDISSEVEQVVTTALAKDPKQRFMSVQAFANALEQACLPGSTAGLRPSSQLLSSSPSFTPTPPSAPSTWVPPTERSNAPVLPPTQMATPSSWVPPTERVSAPVIPPRQIPSPSLYSGPPSPVETGPPVSAERQGIAARDRDEKVNVWHIGKREIVAMVISTILVADLLLISFFGLGAELGGIALSSLVLAFVGIAFGPWVGLVSGGASAILAGLSTLSYSRYYYYSPLSLQFILDLAAIGFIAGLAMLSTKGRYKTLRSISIAAGLSTLGAIIGFSISDAPDLGRDLGLIILLSVIANGIIFTILLLIYNALAGSKEGSITSENVKVWSIGKRHIAGMVIGAILVAGPLFSILSSYYYSYSYFFHDPNTFLGIGLGSLVLALVGATFGPWVGLVSGGGTAILEVIIYSSTGHTSNTSLQFILSFASIGFIAGLATLSTKGRYNTFRAIAIAAGLSTLGTFIGIALLTMTYGVDGGTWGNIILLSIITNGLVLPILLLIYDILFGSKGSSTASEAAGEKVRVWSIGKQQLIAVLIGIPLYGVLSHLYFSIPGEGPFFIILPATLIVLFFGARFGPWVGLFVGELGFLIGEYLSTIDPVHYDTYTYSGNTYSYPYYSHCGNLICYPFHFNSPYASGGISWASVLGNALIGFIVGITFIRTKGRYNTWRSVTVATIIGFFAVSVGMSLAIINQSDYLVILLPTVAFGLVFFPILLFIYNKIVSRRSRALG